MSEFSRILVVVVDGLVVLAIFVWTAVVWRACWAERPSEESARERSLRLEREAGLVFYGAQLVPGEWIYERCERDDSWWVKSQPGDRHSWRVSAQNEACDTMAENVEGVFG